MICIFNRLRRNFLSKRSSNAIPGVAFKYYHMADINKNIENYESFGLWFGFYLSNLKNY